MASSVGTRERPTVRYDAKKEVRSFGPLPGGRETVSSTPFMLFSFDLVNSTAFKTRHSEWPDVTENFYSTVVQSMDEQAKNEDLRHSPRVWKFVGDEVLFHLQVDDIDQVVSAIKCAEATQVAATDCLKHEKNASSLLAVKSTVWIAMAGKRSSNAQEQLGQNASTPVNVFFESEVRGKARAIDFLGPEIDAGFRISRFANSGAITLSADLAYVLREFASSEFCEQIKIVSLQSLKGVWHERYYPVIWYCTHWDRFLKGEGISYDAHLDNDVLRGALTGKTNLRDQAVASIGLLSDVFKNRCDEGSHVHQLLKWFRDRNQKSEPIIQAADPELEVHVVAACIDDRGKILVARRNPSKSVLPGRWDLGCARLEMGQTLEQATVARYRRDFGIEITVHPDPIGTYVVEKTYGSVNGIVFQADLEGVPTILNDAEGRYTNVQLMTVEDVLALQEHECVETLKRDVTRAAAAWEQKRKVASGSEDS